MALKRPDSILKTLHIEGIELDGITAVVCEEQFELRDPNEKFKEK